MRFSLKDYNKVPESAGIYRFCNADGQIIYIGKAKHLKRRVSSYFTKNDRPPKTERMLGDAAWFEVTPVQSEFEALILEAQLIRQYKPKYNIIWKDDKHYIYIKITGEQFPRILLARREDDPQSEYFGPFPSSGVVREMLSLIRSIFPYCIQNPANTKPCFYTHIGLCQPCPASVRSLEGEAYRLERKQYLRNIHHIRMLLTDRTEAVKRFLADNMMEASGHEEFETAAMWRDKMMKLEYLTQRVFSADAYIENPELATDVWKQEQEELGEILGRYFPGMGTVNRIECYDISTNQGRLSVGSMVTFREGQPDKRFYRQFRIRRVAGKPNDFAMLSEVMNRRLRHPEWRLPDLFVIDGGKPQLAALRKVFAAKRVQVPVIGLAKEEEELVVPLGDAFEKIRLPRRSPALHVIQRIRDEAHRFAHKYHTNLRIKSIIGAYPPSRKV